MWRRLSGPCGRRLVGPGSRWSHGLVGGVRSGLPWWLACVPGAFRSPLISLSFAFVNFQKFQCDCSHLVFEMVLLDWRGSPSPAVWGLCPAGFCLANVLGKMKLSDLVRSDYIFQTLSWCAPWGLRRGSPKGRIIARMRLYKWLALTPFPRGDSRPQDLGEGGPAGAGRHTAREGRRAHAHQRYGV